MELFGVQFDLLTAISAVASLVAAVAALVGARASILALRAATARPPPLFEVHLAPVRARKEWALLSLTLTNHGPAAVQVTRLYVKPLHGSLLPTMSGPNGSTFRALELPEAGAQRVEVFTSAKPGERFSHPDICLFRQIATEPDLVIEWNWADDQRKKRITVHNM